MRERWKPIAVAPEYEVSELGRVRFMGERKWSKVQRGTLITATARGGYYFVKLRTVSGAYRVFRLHIIVATAWCDGSGPLVRHLNRQTDDNRAENLAWGDAIANMADAQRHRTTLRGERHPMAKITWRTAAAIRRKYAEGSDTHRSLSERYGIGKSVVSGILQGKRWREWSAVA